jgi:hypothetical protein
LKHEKERGGKKKEKKKKKKKRDGKVMEKSCSMIMRDDHVTRVVQNEAATQLIAQERVKPRENFADP